MAYSVNAVRAILGDVQRYLSEVLSEEYLSPSAAEERQSLLDKISVYVPDRKPSTSPTPYLDMNGIIKKKSDLPVAVKEEYVNSDKKEEVEWYEEFPVQPPPQAPPLPPANAATEPVADPDVSVAQCKVTAVKFGPLKRKEKRFFFGHLHRYWVGLTGNKLLVFNGETDQKPSFVLDVRGYHARPVFSSPTKDTKKKDACFEIVCPGNKTFQFIARTPKDMEQWVSAICVAALSSNKIENELELYDDINVANGAHEDEEIYHDIADVQRDHEVELRLPPRKPAPLPKDYSADRDSVYDDVGFGHHENTYYNVIPNIQGNPEKKDNDYKETQEEEEEEIYDDIGTHGDPKETPQMSNEGSSGSRIQLLIQQMEASFSNGKKPLHNIPIRTTHSLASSASSEKLYEPMETAEDQSDDVLSPVAPQLPPRTHYIRT